MIARKPDPATLVLLKWLKTNNKRTSDFAADCGYSYIHSYQIMRGMAPITDATVGRILMAYGVEGPAIEISKTLGQMNGNGKGK